MWTTFKVFIEFFTILLLFYVFGFLAAKHEGSPQPGIKPAPPAMASEVLITRPPGKSP